MAERTEYAPGTPSWVDIGSTDLEATHTFYTSLFGWERQDAGPVEETGGYGFYTVRGKMVAGYGPAQAEGVWWSMYVNVDDSDAIASKVELNGGQVLVAPMDVMTAGRMGVFVDPTGATFSTWQPQDHKGAELVNEPGAFSWAELLTRDMPAAIAFYMAVFGWTEKNGPAAGYAEFDVDGNVVAGGMAIGPEMPAEVPAHWNIYFGVSDVDASAAKVVELGGSVRMGPMDIHGVGRVAVVGGPHQEGFSLFQF